MILLLPRGIVPGITELVRKRRTRRESRIPERARGDPARARPGGRVMSNLIEVRGVSKSYGGIQALQRCDLDVHEGEINGLIGPNGSGKTTLFNVITGYERIQQGEVRFGGDEITNAPPDRVFELGIGRTFQLTRLFARLSVLENMLVATQRKETLAARGAAARRVARAKAPRDGAAGVRRDREARPRARRATSPTASASCSSSPRCWSPTRRSCCSTSPPAASTRR